MVRGGRYRRALAAMLVLGWSASSPAQEAAAAAAQPPPHEAGTADDSAELPQVQVRGVSSAPASITKIGVPEREIPQTITVIDRRSMDVQNLQTLDDVMLHAPGITVQPYQQLTTAYYARGFKIDSFEQDGVPVLLGDTASPPQDVSIYEQVEILSGADGLLHGAGNPAATVNLVRKRPGDRFEAAADIGIGSWGHSRGVTDIGGPLAADGALRGRMVASRDDRDFFYDVASLRSSNLYAIGEADLAPRTTLSLGLQKQRIRSVPDMSGVPLYADGGDIGLPRSIFLDTAWGRFDWNTTRVFGELRQALGEDWRARVLFDRLNGSSDLKYAAANGAVDRLTGTGPTLNAAAYRFGDSQSSLDGYASGPVELFGRRHELLFGASRLETRSTQYAAALSPVPAGPVDVFGWDPFSVPEPTVGAYSTRGPTRVEQTAAYAMARLALSDPLKLMLGGRLTRWKQTAAAATAEPDTQVTPYGGLVYALTPEWSAYASFTQVFQPQTQTTWSGDLLDPVKGTNYEAGLKGSLSDGRIEASVAAFQIRQTNRAQVDPDHACAGPVCYYVAQGEVRSRGLDAALHGRVAGWDLSAAYTFDVTRYVKDATSQGRAFAPFAPKHLLRVWADRELPWQAGRWSVGLGVQAQSGYEVVAATTRLAQGAYTLVNGRIACRLGPNLDAALNVANLFDRRYYQSLSSTAWNNRYGEPRSVMLTLRARY